MHAKLLGLKMHKAARETMNQVSDLERERQQIMDSLSPETVKYLEHTSPYWDHVPNNEQKHSFIFMQAHKNELEQPDSRLSQQVAKHRKQHTMRQVSR